MSRGCGRGGILWSSGVVDWKRARQVRLGAYLSSPFVYCSRHGCTGSLLARPRAKLQNEPCERSLAIASEDPIRVVWRREWVDLASLDSMNIDEFTFATRIGRSKVRSGVGVSKLESPASGRKVVFRPETSEMRKSDVDHRLSHFLFNPDSWRWRLIEPCFPSGGPRRLFLLLS